MSNADIEVIRFVVCLVAHPTKISANLCTIHLPPFLSLPVRIHVMPLRVYIKFCILLHWISVNLFFSVFVTRPMCACTFSACIRLCFPKLFRIEFQMFSHKRIYSLRFACCSSVHRIYEQFFRCPSKISMFWLLLLIG